MRAKAIKVDVLAKRFNLSLRQGFALEYVLKVGHLTIQDYEKLCPNTTRRTLQRELKELVDRHILQGQVLPIILFIVFTNRLCNLRQTCDKSSDILRHKCTINSINNRG